ncbi:MAG: SRPBCC family protein [Actinomycetota bacterium]|jgi:uncharacterized protein YndB with AHSA1/START domain
MPHDAQRELVHAERMIAAPPQQVFDLLADPRMHKVFDGSGTVRDPHGKHPERLSLGAKFGMNMRIGLPYRMTNTVVEFEEGKRIGWRHVGGHVWRYVLTPEGSGTRLVEEFDYSTNRARILLTAMNAIERNEQSIIATLDNIERHFAGS